MNDRAPRSSAAAAARFSTTALGERLCGPIVEAAPLAIVAVGLDGQIQFVNQESERLFGYAREEIVGRSIELLVPAEARVEHARLRELYCLNPETRSMGTGRELRAQRKDGGGVPVEIALKPIDLDGVSFILAIVIDISERKRSQQQFARALEAAPIAMLVLDSDGYMVMANREAEELYGYEREELIGNPIDMLVPVRLQARDPESRARFFGSAMALRLGTARHEFYGLRKDGVEIPVEIGLSTMPSEQGPMKLVTIIDVTERRRWETQIQNASEALEQRVRERTMELAEANQQKEALLVALRAKSEQLERLSCEDALTGLLNRRAFDEKLAEEIRRAARMSTPLVVAMLDIDYFKHVNDRYGHAVGDAVLKEVASLMRHECRAIDIIARYGGEEFALALPGSDLQAGITLCERIRNAFCAFDWERIAPGLAVTISAGVSEWSPGTSISDLLAVADANLYAAKRDGRNRVRPQV